MPALSKGLSHASVSHSHTELPSSGLRLSSGGTSRVLGAAPASLGITTDRGSKTAEASKRRLRIAMPASAARRRRSIFVPVVWGCPSNAARGWLSVGQSPQKYHGAGPTGRSGASCGSSVRTRTTRNFFTRAAAAGHAAARHRTHSTDRGAHGGRPGRSQSHPPRHLQRRVRRGGVRGAARAIARAAVRAGGAPSLAPREGYVPRTRGA